ncbi:MAG: hypothetical protein MJ211_06580 [Bacteroidales bacterium]|nr:hypothetical protein [Bacteroidales bacterium]
MNKLLKIKQLSIALLLIAITSCSSETKNNSSENNQSGSQSNEQVTENSQKDEELKLAEQKTEEQKQQNEDPTQDPVPLEEISQNYSIPTELKYCVQNDEYLFDKFYPIGWSKDGHFAYIKEPADEAAGLYFFEFVIQNMISDKIVYSWKPEDDPDEGSVKQMWKDYEMLFVEKLNKYGIIQQKNIKLEGTEFTKNNKKFKIIIENDMEPNEDFGFEVVKSTDISIKSPDLGSKQVYNYTEKEYNLCVGRIVQGVIMSPFEDRVAIMVKSESCGYEGPPNVISQFLVGTNLTESFKK